ncbi:MAG: MFS transporter [Anaerolineae bacterium]|nr:MFS transporter [Anaerolineae bacterium]MDQ7035627.1 MFS transporter [Anaerolineae bacterium]
MLRTFSAEEKYDSNYRWLMLALAALTPTLVLAMPNMSLPVLFPEISAELNLSLVQVGWIWAVSSITGMFIGLVGGTVGDRFGARRTLIMLCLLTGVAGALRGFSANFITFMMTSFLLGLVQPAIAVNVFKIAGEWFRPAQLGMASGVISAGFAAGLSLGALVSASILSPLLGSWRQVFFFYGILAVIIGLLWYMLHPRDEDSDATRKSYVPLRQGLPHVMRLRKIWLIGLGGMGIRACVVGATGYLPTYLRDIGWETVRADNALATFYFVSLLAAIPIAVLSDKMQIRRGFLMLAALMITLGVGLLSVVEGNLVWVAVMIAGVTFDALMAIQMTTIMEVEGVGVAYIGTALGFSGVIRNFGGTFSPPLGNSLAVYGLNVPFIFWAAMGLIGLVVFSLLPSKQKKKVEDNIVTSPVPS